MTGRGRLPACLLAGLCGIFAPAAGAGLPVWVTIPPQKYLVERVGGDRVKVEVLVAPGRSPATYAPTARQMARLARAEIFFAIGLPVERAVLPRVAASMPGVEIVHLADPVPPGADHGGHGHVHGPGCAHGDADPHVWLDPSWMAEQAGRVSEVLSRHDPDGAVEYAGRAKALAAELAALDAELRERMGPFEGRAFFINHPSLGHFAEAYGLRQMAVEEGGSAPGPRRLASLVKEAQASGVRAVFSQPQFEGSSVEVLAEALGVPVIEVNPLEEDYFRNLRAVAGAVESAFGEL